MIGGEKEDHQAEAAECQDDPPEGDPVHVNDVLDRGAPGLQPPLMDEQAAHGEEEGQHDDCGRQHVANHGDGVHSFGR